MELLYSVLVILVFFATFYIFLRLLVVAQDMDRRRTYGDEYADWVLECVHKGSRLNQRNKKCYEKG